MMSKRKLFVTVVCLSAVLLAGTQWAQAQTLTIKGTVGDSGKYLLTGSAVTSPIHSLLKMTFETTTSGHNLSLCSGTVAQFNAGTCGTFLNGSGGPGFKFLTIVDAATLNGLQLYVILNVGSAPASFTVLIE